jgi:hypothetical protein
MKSITSMIWFVGSVIGMWLIHAGGVAASSLGAASNITFELRQGSHLLAIDPPNAEQIGYGYNCLLGQTPAEQREALVGSELFQLTAGDDRDIRTVKYVENDETFVIIFESFYSFLTAKAQLSFPISILVQVAAIFFTINSPTCLPPRRAQRVTSRRMCGGGQVVRHCCRSKTNHRMEWTRALTLVLQPLRLKESPLSLQQQQPCELHSSLETRNRPRRPFTK